MNASPGLATSANGDSAPAAEEANAALESRRGALLIHTLGASAFAVSEARSEVREQAAKRHAEIDAEELPAMASVAEELTAALGGDQAFEHGLAALLDGIEMRGAR